jgi:hypothetical protein
MNTVRSWLLAAAFVSGTAGALAQEAPVLIPAEFLTSVTPDSFLTPAPASSGEKPAAAMEVRTERPQTIAGASYTVVMPFFNGSDGNTSYLRLSNYALSSVRYTIDVVGTPSGRDYGGFIQTVGSEGIVQLSLADILQRGDITLLSTDTSVAIYLKTADYGAWYQHVLYNNASGSFENLTVCPKGNTVNASDYIQAKVQGVHTTAIPAYPSTIILHNFQPYAETLTFVVTSPISGVKPAYTAVVKANSTYTIPFSYLQSAMNWTPGNTEYLATLAVSAVGARTGNTSFLVENLVHNNVLNTYVNMTESCLVTTY